MTWTHFWDMHSGGGQKAPWQHIYIEAPEAEAKVIFYNRFGHNPERVTCTCCGNDYSVSEAETLAEASGYQRGCDYAWFLPDGTEYQGEDVRIDYPSNGTYLGAHEAGVVQRIVERVNPDRAKWNPYRTVDEYRQEPEVLVIEAADIAPEERVGTVPTQGYVWQD